MFEELLRYNKNITYGFCDLETYNLGLNFVNNRPWQIGIIEVKGDVITATQDIIVNWLNDCPWLKIKPDVAAKNHYNEVAVRKIGFTPKEGFQKTWEVLKRVDKIIMHNGLKFDLYLLRAWAEENGEDWHFLTAKIIDTKSIAQGIKLGLPYNPKDDWMEYQYRMANSHVKGVKTKLSILAKEYNIPVDEVRLHDAIYDLEVNKAVWDKLKFQIEI